MRKLVVSVLFIYVLVFTIYILIIQFVMLYFFCYQQNAAKGIIFIHGGMTCFEAQPLKNIYRIFE
jgi:hypothetical protein